MKRLEVVDRTERIFRNQSTPATLDIARPTREPLTFHRLMPNYEPSPLREAPLAAAALGLERLWVKDESNRLGLPAFKILGASWAVYRALTFALRELTGNEPADPESLDTFSQSLAPLRPLTLACATDGNHGRAVARMAKLLDLSSRIFVPADMAVARIEAIRSEGAEIVVVDGTYDDSVAMSAEASADDCLVISDTAWPGYTQVPRWVIDGYSTIFWEIEDELAARAEAGPDLVVLQMGVGAFAAAGVIHNRRPGISPSPYILGVEPTRAACVLASMEEGEIVEVPGPHDSVMSGLNCGIPSSVAWPFVSKGIDAFLAVDDGRTIDAMRELVGDGIVAGECGAASLAGLTAWARQWGGHVGGKRALIVSTEGITNPSVR